MSSFWKDPPTRIRVYPCPSCQEIISADAASCRFCNLPIDTNTAQKLLAESRRVTTAIARANTFRMSTGLAPIVAAITLYNAYVERSLILSMVGGAVVAVGYGVQWLFRNSSIVTQDEDYPAAIKKVRWTIVVWLAVLLLQTLTYLVLTN
jgi:hypothetical protein